MLLRVMELNGFSRVADITITAFGNFPLTLLPKNQRNRPTFDCVIRPSVMNVFGEKE